MHRARRNLRVGTFNYGITYFVTRFTLIIASAIVAADQNLSGGGASWLVDWVPALSLLVAIGTAFDTWYKPQQKWKGYMESRDALADLLIQVNQGLPEEEARTKFVEVRRQHRRNNVF
ncbi:hypothetical protein OHB00_03465 [Streptomyces sp. NBC_00631]|uniref:hypothetical protein n=1 Tax=Streptomyces sp. NBC_00631 TaxID=2975793 RepID=UPI0030DE3BB3